MGELRLICPGCGAEYRVDGALIPPQGRDVECTGCGRIWRQPGAGAAPAETVTPAPRRHPIDFAVSRSHGAVTQPRAGREDPVTQDSLPRAAEAASAAENLPAPSAPRLNNPLPADVLSILTEEADRERAARAAEAPPSSPGAAAWPATTITSAIEGGGPAPVPPAAGLAKQEQPSPPPVTNRPAKIAAEPAAPHPAHDAARDPETATGSGGRGFALGILLMLAALGLYLVAPMVPPDNPAGPALAVWRDWGDEFRRWLGGLF